ncbi:MAG: hypothetical protein LAO24_17720 [Acidobacteriia bacterium]|nr:hypothetical protein [Terriglobia bacterium]
MKRKHVLAAILGAAVLLSLSGCGTSDKMVSVTLSSAGSAGFFEVKGEGGVLQLKATANYTSGKLVDVTNWVTYTVTPTGFDLTGAALNAPPLTMTISPTGLVTAVQPFVCTFTDLNQTGTGNPSWALVGSYQITATYKGVVSQPVFVGVASATGNAPDGSCGP